MATIAEALVTNYALARRRNAKLRKGEYMQRAFPGRYKNEASAYQAYNQTVKQRRPGKRIAPLTQPKRTVLIRGEQRPTSYQEGLWKVVVHFNYIDQDGNIVENQEISFNMESSEYTDLLAVPYLEDAMLPIAEEKLAEYEQSFTNTQITYLEILPINTRKKSAVDIDYMNI